MSLSKKNQGINRKPRITKQFFSRLPNLNCKVKEYIIEAKRFACLEPSG